MPTYEYECKTCGHNFEVFQAMSDEPLNKCPQCGKAVRRLIFGGTGVIFKGSGFYVTDKSKSSQPGGTAKSGNKPAETVSAGGDKSSADSGQNAAASPGTDKAVVKSGSEKTASAPATSA